MKTQIILRRTFLIAVALFICINVNNGSKKVMPEPHQVSYASTETTSSEQTTKDDTKAMPHKSEDPYLTQIEHDQETELCDFKHHEKRILWRCIANIAFAILYHLIILMPTIGESLRQVVMMIKH